MNMNIENKNKLEKYFELKFPVGGKTQRDYK